MTETPAVRLYLRFLALAVSITLAMGLLGYWPTQRLGGTTAVAGMMAACSTSVLATLVGAIPMALRSRRVGEVRGSLINAALGAMALRLVILVLAGVLLVASGWFAPAPFLIWLAVSYAALLGAETWYAVRILAVRA